MEDIVNKIYKKNRDNLEKAIMDGVKNGDVNFMIWFGVLSDLMGDVEKFRKLKGRDKKEVVVLVVIKSVKEIDMEESEKEKVGKVLENVLPKFIDMAVSLSKKVNIDGLIKKIKKKLSCC